MKYTFHSTDPDNFNEIYCPISYQGVCRRVRWWVNELTSNHNIVILDTDDYIIFDAPNDTNLDQSEDGLLGGTTITWNPSKQYTSSSSLKTDFNNSGTTDITLELTNSGCYRFKCSEDFSITGMSYNMKQVLGFYYVDDGTTLTATYGQLSNSSSSNGSYNNSSGTTTAYYYYIEAKAIGFENFTPVWFLISNLGQPNQITANNDKWKPLFPAIVMNIQNTFNTDTTITWSNSDYVSESPTSALSNLKVKLVDANLEPIKILNPVYITVIVQEIPEEERQTNEEAFEEAEANVEAKNLRIQTMTKYQNNKLVNQQKVEAGVSVEPEPFVFNVKQETNPEEIKIAQEMVIEQTQD